MNRGVRPEVAAFAGSTPLYADGFGHLPGVVEHAGAHGVAPGPPLRPDARLNMVVDLRNKVGTSGPVYDPAAPPAGAYGNYHVTSGEPNQELLNRASHVAATPQSATASDAMKDC